jgi:hypothetical protein
MRKSIMNEHENLLRILRMKSVNYASLRRALVPSADRSELAFLFDSTRIDNHWYGHEVAQKLVPLINRKSTCSFLVGDLIADKQKIAFDVLRRHITLHNSEIKHTSQLYCVYLNNLSKTMAETIHDGLISYDPYVGHVNVTFSSPMKNWLSATLKRYFTCLPSAVRAPHSRDNACFRIRNSNLV